MAFLALILISLAWIMQAYSLYNWESALRLGLQNASFSGGAAEALQVYDDGTGPAMYVGGVFTQAGGLPARHIAKWSRPPPPCP